MRKHPFAAGVASLISASVLVAGCDANSSWCTGAPCNTGFGFGQHLTGSWPISHLTEATTPPSNLIDPPGDPDPATVD